MEARLLFDIALEPSFDFSSREYATLFAASDATAFQHPLWLATLYDKLLTANDATPLVIVARHADRSLAMVLPLLRRRYGALRVVEFADLRVSDFVTPVADAVTFETILGDDAAVGKIRALLRPYDLLRIGKLDPGALALGRLLGAREPATMPTSAYAVPLERDFESWRDKYLDRCFVSQFARKERQLARAGNVEFDCVTEPVEIAATLCALRTFRYTRFELNGGGELLQVPDYFAFYKAICLASQEYARVYRLSIDGRTIGGMMGLVHRGTFLVLLPGFVQTEFKNCSIGSLVTQYVVKDCIARGDRLIDFTIGDEPYKMVFGATPRPMRQIAKAGSPLGLVAGATVDRLPAVKTLARRIFHRGDPRGAPPASDALEA